MCHGTRRLAWRWQVAWYNLGVIMFYSADKHLPTVLVTSYFIARPLRADDAAIDHAAYMASLDIIRVHSGGRWPSENFTVVNNRVLADQHERDHNERRAFAFLLLAPDQQQSLGCFYLLPLLPFLRRVHAPADLITSFSEGTAMATFWLRQDTEASNLADHVVIALDDWLATEWAFDDHVFRVNVDERRSIAALERAGLQRRAMLDLALPPHRYFLYGRR